MVRKSYNPERTGIKVANDGNKIVLGVFGFILSILGLLFSFQVGTDNILLYALFLIMVVVGIILVAKSLSD